MTQERHSRRLGRGLEALLGAAPQSRPDQQPSTDDQEPRQLPVEGLTEIPLSEIRPNPYQPRREFTLAELNELRDSIKAAGLLQPVTVRRSASGRGYELVAGERRLRAVKDLGWRTIPAVIRDYDDRTSLTLALVENLQREDLNPIEEATGYARLATEFGLSQTEIAELVGKDRSTVANLLRVLQLPQEIRKMLEAGDLTIGHARPLLALDDPAAVLRLARDVVRHGLSTRAVEERVRQSASPATTPKRGRPRKESRPEPPELRHATALLRRRLQTDVSITTTTGEQGQVRVSFYSHDDLTRLLELVGATE